MREPKETKLDRLKADLVRAKEKASEWQARVRDIERQITEQENIEIVQAVRSILSEPEDLRAVLNMIRATKETPAENFGKEHESL
ncbi:MAG: DUF4315 family protein [Oscillospiraceae bacterium]|nr:DUF4315 family protein [Oscillospiraceae bacterium]